MIKKYMNLKRFMIVAVVAGFAVALGGCHFGHGGGHGHGGGVYKGGHSGGGHGGGPRRGGHRADRH